MSDALTRLADRLAALGRGEIVVADGSGAAADGALGELARAVSTMEERRELGSFEAYALG